jgi:hypothetical protein
MHEKWVLSVLLANHVADVSGDSAVDGLVGGTGVVLLEVVVEYDSRESRTVHR